MIVVEVKNEILGDSEFWRGPEDKIAEIRNVPARLTAQQVVKDGKPRVCGMWHVRQEMTPNETANWRAENGGTDYATGT